MPKFYGLPKVFKEGMPLRPIVSSIEAVTYERSKELSRILKPLVGKIPYQVQKNKEFIQHLEGFKLGPDEIIMSYDVKALFTSVPIQPSLNMIKKLLEEDQEVQKRTSMTVEHTTCLLEFLPKEYIFLHFKINIMSRWKELPWVLQSSPIVANIYIEDFEMKAINTSLQPPLMWKRFADDTFIVIKAAQKQNFLDHINSVDHHIQFISEEP